MFYLKRNYQDSPNSVNDEEIHEIYVEVDLDGKVTREIELDSSGQVKHKCPSKDYEHGTYGFFDMVRFEMDGLENDLSREDFENLWNKAQ